MKFLKKLLIQSLKEKDLKLATLISDKYSRIINVEVYGNEEDNEEEEINYLFELLRLI